MRGQAPSDPGSLLTLQMAADQALPLSPLPTLREAVAALAGNA